MNIEEKAKEYVNELYMQTTHLFKERCIAREGYLSGYTQAVTDRSAENEKLREALREIVQFTDEMQNAKTDFDYNMSSTERKAAIIRAKQLITEEK
ncbi:hypothetical protein [Dysgonomonas capnocytophagoides]|uniref:hypothetical protein n=1 Tax=Dysgonomonas capnocytophagoides TaxID=45254 RepID=UPI002922F0DB|nr:hypothetical protein DCPSUM001_33100 [Dysgonomonas capnocytophagoides]